MAPGIVYDDVAAGAEPETGGLFEGKQFWVAQRVPSRSALLDLIKANGGSIVQLEKQADYMIADHYRKLLPPGSIAYTFIHKSIEKGEIQDPSDYPAGPPLGTAREPGSISRPAKGTRTAFTPEEDRILYQWTKTAQDNGVAVSGNELYKKLEQSYPRHTWQSWRDRYVKKVQYMSASTLNIADDEPQSQILDLVTEVAKPGTGNNAGIAKNKDGAQATAVEKQPVSTNASSSRDQATSAPAVKRGLIKNKDKARIAAGDVKSEKQYTVDQLAAIFDRQDWESLYAFVEEIASCSEGDDSYAQAWKAWAESRENQTAEQWRQYYEEVVRPQWLRDSVAKREQVRLMVERRIQEENSTQTQSQTWSQVQEDNTTEASPSKEAVFTQSLKPTASKSLPSDTVLPSESTAQQETPKYLRDGYESALKRIRGDVDSVAESSEASRPTKVRRRSDLPPTLVEPEKLNGTAEETLEISSALDSSRAGTSEEHQVERSVQKYTSEQSGQVDYEVEGKGTALENDELYSARAGRQLDDDVESQASSTDLAHTTPIPRPTRVPDDDDDDTEEEQEEEDDLPANTPTPRAKKFNAFDTQAILSPSQPQNLLTAIPRPPLDSSPPHHPESEASVTHSLQEFSSYLEDRHDPNPTHPSQQHPTPPRPASPSPSITSSTTTSSSDPDSPLSTGEIDPFYAEQSARGFNNEYISKALKRTRFRPGLAETVLEAWRHGLPLPMQRGVWSIEDDEAVERGDGRALEHLEEKHSLDGWGGVTERLNFLRAWRGR